MAQRAPSLVLAFLLAGVTAHVGLATASSGERPDRAEHPASPLKVARNFETSAPSPKSIETEVDWPSRIDASLRRLGPAPIREAAPDEALKSTLEGMIGRARGRAVAVHVRDLADGTVIYDHDGELSLVPASNQKLLTASAALELLGPDHRFRTTLWRDGATLYLVGEGDPGFMAHHLHALVGRASATGHLAGVTRIVVDDTAFGDEHFGPGSHEEGDGPSYLAPSGAVSLSFNTVEVVVRPSAAGEPAAVSIVPESTKVRLEGAVHTGRGRALAVKSSAGAHGETVISIDGAIAANHRKVSIRRRIADPGLFTGGAFAAVLARQSGSAAISVERGHLSNEAVLVAVHESPPLIDLLDSAMKYSNNFTSEQLLRAIGMRATGTGSFAAGTDVLSRFFAAIGHEDDVKVVNGSGLGSRGRATPRALVDVVATGLRPGSEAAILTAAMSHPGGDGTLRHRLPYAGTRVRAKTGTLSGVTALSGVITSADGRRTWAFSILINGGHADENRRLQDRMVAQLLYRMG